MLYFSTRGPANEWDFDGEYSFIIENDRLSICLELSWNANYAIPHSAFA